VNFREKIQRWYEGNYIPPDNRPDSPIVFVLGRYKRHWTSQALHWAVDFYLREWKWLLPFVVAIIGTIVAIAKL